MATGHRTAELRSIELHRLVAEQLDTDMVARARARLDRWAAAGTLHPEWAAAWRELLDQPPGTIRAALTEDSERMRALRQSSPFAGELDEQQRQAVIRRVH